MPGCTSLDIKQLGKGGVNQVTDLQRQSVDELIYELTEKLYKRNPRELRKQPQATIESKISELRAQVINGQPLLINGAEDIAVLDDSFDPAFNGDRVYQLMAGLLSMVHKSYGYRTDFYLMDKLDQQKLYNSARNIEVLAWRLRNTRDANGEPLLLSTQLSGPVVNLSYERLYGKLIALQDMAALVAANGNTRLINSVAQGIVRVVFLPI